MSQSQLGGNVFFLLIGAILVFAMHGGFAFLEVGTVRKKTKLTLWSKLYQTLLFQNWHIFLIGYGVAYGINFFADVATVQGGEGTGFDGQSLSLVKFFFMLTFAAAIPAIISGGIAERAKFGSQLAASAIIVALIYPFFEGIIWNGKFDFQSWFKSTFGYAFNGFAGSVVVHGVGGWLALGAVLMLSARHGRYGERERAFPPSSVPWLALDHGCFA